ncbi:MAG TPA: glyoxalase/bleomycin resistance/extradiol dioxygenase family protein, partial [Longimicrobium sp.]
PVTGVTPYLTVSGQRGRQAVDWYARAFGAELAMEPNMAEDGVRIIHAHLRINGGSVMLSDDFPEYHGQVDAPSPAGVTLHIQTDGPDALWTRAVEAGAEVTMPLADQFWGDRYGQLRDPFGHAWSIGAPVKG